MSSAALSTTGASAPTHSLEMLVPVGRALYAAIFIMASFGHFSPQTIAYASSQGVPLASLAVPLSGIMSLVGGLSVALGYKTRYGAALLVAFLVPVTLMMHKFWAVPDPMMAQMQQAMFLKNVALLGTALLLMYFGAGPGSLDTRRGVTVSRDA
jgi:putative oxidoreductase